MAKGLRAPYLVLKANGPPSSLISFVASCFFACAGVNCVVSSPSEETAAAEDADRAVKDGERNGGKMVCFLEKSPDGADHP